ncbi:STAS domain-containing protein [Streptomyces sp. NPDC059506]|uniref:STAS domain-containing protein n=1 Tax=Streptomyces TaxID=1883 RepID=UPI000CABF3E0|nr:STAS domain-containing protein [Streptomyces sp. SCUT-3]PLW72230.1 anti-anti-sigma factor [Streptomyces sp. DJ]QMV21259.1 STAS domain-containing protein [Streptomyces sp. SCUT-3]
MPDGDVNGARLVELLTARREQLVTEWVEKAVPTVRGRLGELELRQELGELYEALLGGVRDARNPSDLHDDAFGEARALLAEISRSRARHGFTPWETAVGLFALKDVVLTAVDPGGRNAEYLAFLDFSRLLDAVGLFTFETYTRAREQVINDQAEQLLELATPVVKLWEGVVAVPLVGTLDSARTQVVMEKLLQALVDTGSEHAIIDITGVPAVDTQVAQHLLKTVVAARLMGAECIVSGIRPQIAQTIVALGIEFGDIVTKASLADALRHALRSTGVQVDAPAPSLEA